jgi:S-methylmethionine-dependent homocysteine/selenocysteine methylase
MIILDGGLGRQLMAIGAPFRQPEWSALALIEGPQFVRQVHDEFIAAGADVITTNSYAIVPFHIGEQRYAAESSSLLRLAAKLAREAADAAPHPVRVAASIPPMCGSYQPDAFDPLLARHRMQNFREHLTPTADIIIGETLSSIAEAEIFLEMFADHAADLWLSVSLEDAKFTKGTPKLRSGEMLAELLPGIDGSRLDALLFNCSQPEVMSDAILLARAARDTVTARRAAPRTLIGVYANAFPLMDEEYAGANGDLFQLRQDITPGAYLAYASEWAGIGADIIGGCCGITPKHIEMLSQNLKP